MFPGGELLCLEEMGSNGISSNCGLNVETCINDLTDDCLLIVVQFLENWADRDAFGLTCKRWLKIQSGVRHSLKCHFPHTSDASQNCFKYLVKLLARFPALHSVSLAGCTEIPDSALTVFQTAGSKVQCLSLDCCFGITDEGLAYICNGCTALISLSLYRCNVSNIGLGYIARGCSNLEIINLSYCQGISDSGMAVLAEGCPGLKVVTISYCRNIQGEGFEKHLSLLCLEAESCHLTDAGLCEIAKGGSLQYLNLSNSRSGIGLGSRGLASIGMGCSNLEFLHLRMCRSLDDSAVIEISKGCPLLKEWNMAVCPQVRVAGWHAVAVHCRNLQILHVNRCKHFCDRSMFFVRSGCPKLSSLHLHGCPNLTSMAVEVFKQARNNVLIIPHECMSAGPCLDNFVNK
eukprot:Gb_00784 [translate_table: standard]